MGRRSRAWWALGLVCFFWGTTYLAIRVGVREEPPLVFSGARFFVAGVLLAAYARATGRRRPARGEWGRLAFSGVLMLVVANGTLAWAETRVPSGVASLLVALVPLWMVVQASLYGERVTARGWTGVAVGLAGTVLLLWPDLAASRLRPGFAGGALALCCSTGVWAWASLFLKRRPHRADAVAALAFQKLVGGAAAVVLGLAVGERPAWPPSAAAAGAFIYLVFAGSVIGYSAYLYALARLPTERVAMYAYVNPVVAVTLGVVVLGERADAFLVAGAAVALTGVYLASTGRAAPPLARAEARAAGSAL